MSSCVSHQRIDIGVMEQPSFSQDATGSPLGVMHRLDESHQGDVGAETLTDGGTEDKNKI